LHERQEEINIRSALFRAKKTGGGFEKPQVTEMAKRKKGVTIDWKGLLERACRPGGLRKEGGEEYNHCTDLAGRKRTLRVAGHTSERAEGETTPE